MEQHTISSALCTAQAALTPDVMPHITVTSRVAAFQAPRDTVQLLPDHGVVSTVYVEQASHHAAS